MDTATRVQILENNNNNTNVDHSNYNIVEIGQNTEKSPGDLRRLAVFQTLLKIHLLTLV